MKNVTFLTLGVLFLGVGFFYFVIKDDKLSQSDANRFFSAYKEYSEMEEAFERAVYLPGTGDNVVRRGMDSKLIQVLDERTPPEQRLLLASEGVELTNDLFDQISAISIGGERIQERTNALNAIAETFSEKTPQEEAFSITHLAFSRISVAERIGEILEERRIETRRVFETVVADRGSLTSSHLELLNKRVGPAEVRFDELSRLYTYFETLDEREDALYKEFSKNQLSS